MSRPTKPYCMIHACDFDVHHVGVRIMRVADFGPYRIDSGDEWVCPKGGERIVVGWGESIAHHFEPRFAKEVERGVASVEGKPLEETVAS